MIDLYISEACPYCRKVLDFCKNYDIKFNKKDVSNPENRDELESLGGKIQVPFLVDNDNNTKMYESDDIINYLKSKV